MDFLDGPDGADQRITLDYVLDEEGYQLTFTWNDLLEAWYLDLALEDETELLSGVRVTTARHMLRQHQNTVPELPQGTLVVLPRGDDYSDPGRYDLAEGGRCQLVYVPLAEQEALVATIPARDGVLTVKAVEA